MNINELYPSNYLKASDLNGRKVKVTIKGVETEQLGDKSKAIVYFVGKDKGLACNKTNAMVIASAYGPETAGWSGKDIYLYPTKVNMNGQMVDAIRVEPALEVTEEAPF